jgi:hypothetical protein
VSALVWLMIPLGALVLASLWVAWSGRPRRRPGPYEGIARHERFKAAFEANRAPDRSDGSPRS